MRTLKLLSRVTMVLTFGASGLIAAVRAPATEVTGVDPALFSQMKWRCIGPSRGGRSVAVAGVADQPLLYYMGSTGGGIWKTEDGGNSWNSIGDKFLKTGSVGAIAVAPSDPNVIYVGMGEACVRGNFSHGDGVYKSTDAGKTWTLVGLSDTRQIGKIRVHPKDPNLVYVAALGHVFGANDQRGVFRSKDGGTTWERILFVNDQTGAVDLAMDTTNPRILYAAFWQVRRTPYSLESGGLGSGLHKSTDGGDTWTELTKGMPEGIKGRIGVTVSPADPERLWAIVEADKGGIFRSDDGGESFRNVNDDRQWRQRAWYYTHIFADTQDADTVYVLNVQFGKSKDGGKTFSSIRVPHGDNHDLWIAPENNRRMIESNDGGANISFNGGRSWSRLDNQPTAQFYHVITDNSFPYRVLGAQQDNSTVSISSRARLGWREDFHAVGGGESGYIAPHPDNPDIVYAGSYGGFLTRYDHKNQQMRNITVWPDNPMGWGAGELKHRFQWTFPIVISPHDSGTIYAAGNVLFKSTNEGQSWEPISPDLTTNDKNKQGPSGGPITHDNTSVEYYCTIFAVTESPHEKSVIWAGTDDGLVQLTRDGGRNWTEVTPLDVPKWAQISMIEVSPHDPGTCYLAANAYKMDDLTPYIFKTTDYGQSWTSITNGIARDAFVRVVREDPKRKGLLYAGTETGVYTSFDDGRHWQSLQLELPIVPITDLVIKDTELVAATQGRSFWILNDLTQLHQIDDKMAAANVFLLDPHDVYDGVDRGVEVIYRLKDKPTDGLTLAFLNGSGEEIRTFESGKDDKEDEEPAFHAFGGGGGKKAPAEAGVNTFTWNTRYPDATEVKGAVMWGGSITGPSAPPGTYRVRLTVGDDVQTQSFEILKDPRATTTQDDYDKRFAMLLEIRDRLSETHDAINRIRTIKRQASAAAKHVKTHKDAKDVGEAAKELEKKLTAVEEELIQTKSKSGQDPLNFPIKLNNKIAALSFAVGYSDGAPTAQSRVVLNELSAELAAQREALERIVKTEVPAFNKLIEKLRVPAINLEEEKE